MKISLDAAVFLPDLFQILIQLNLIWQKLVV